MRAVWVAVVVLIVGVAWSAGRTQARAAPAEMTVVCTPAGVATFVGRIQVRCTQSFSGVVLFSVGSSDTAAAARFMSLATSAMIAGRNVRITFDPAEQSGAPVGCLPADCRLMRGLEMF